jgi:subtilisin family serine protease
VGAAVTEPADDFSDTGYNDDRTRCAVSSGALIVAAAGNNASTAKEFPAAESVYGLVAVAASDENRQLAPFSNFGSWVGIAAPGNGITSSVPGGGYATWGGTSMAAPWVSGAAALLIANDPTLSPRGVQRRLAQSAAPLCGTWLLQIDPLAALMNTSPAPVSCP